MENQPQINLPALRAGKWIFGLFSAGFYGSSGVQTAIPDEICRDWGSLLLGVSVRAFKPMHIVHGHRGSCSLTDVGACVSRASGHVAPVTIL